LLPFIFRSIPRQRRPYSRMAQKVQVPRRKCGKFDFELPVLGLGGWSFGSGDYWGAQEQKDVDEVVELGISVGANYFDTAEAYDGGKAETALGIALKGKQGIIGSKVLPQNCTPEKLRQSLNNSLKRLQVDNLFLYMVHWPLDTHKFPPETPESDIPQVSTCFETLKELQKAGKITHVGVSNFGVAQLKVALATGIQITVNQLGYGLFLRSIEYDVLPFCRENGIGVIGYSPLLQGLLTGKYKTIDEMPDWRTRTRHFNSTRNRSRHGGPGCENEMLVALDQIRKVAEELGVTMTDLALAWAIHTPGITTIIPGSRTKGQLESNLKSIELKLTNEVYEKLAKITDPVKAHLGKYIDIYENIQNQRCSY